MAHDHNDHSDHAEPNGIGDGNGNGDLYGVLAEFDTPGELVEAARKVRDAGYTDFDCFSPFPVHGIDEAMGIKRTILPVLIFGGGFTGTVGGLLLQWWCNAYNWPWNISGKPTWSIPANVPIAFETTILLSVFTAFFGMWILNKLPQVWHPFFRLERFGRVTDDAFLLGIEAKDQRFDATRTKKLLEDAGALAVEDCYFESDPARKNMPKWITALIVSSTAFALIPFAIAAKARNSHSSEPHIHIFPDMDFQPKYKADTADDFFADGRANRGALPGTIAYGSLNADDLLFQGIEDKCTGVQTSKEKVEEGFKVASGTILDFKGTLPEDQGATVELDVPDGAKTRRVKYLRSELTNNGPCWTRDFPRNLDLGVPMVERGQNRYNIYCAPCHGFDGKGMGVVGNRIDERHLGAPLAARDLTGEGIVRLPNGQIFNTISNGTGKMMGYAAQIPHKDRWAIVLYIRALQRSQYAQGDDVPDTERPKMQMPGLPKPAEPKK